MAARGARSGPSCSCPGLNTLLLLSSSVTMQLAVRAIGRGEVATMRLAAG